jgi:hypothetical protein
MTTLSQELVYGVLRAAPADGASDGTTTIGGGCQCGGGV